MRRCICLFLIASYAIGLFGRTGETLADHRPNIVLLLADDLGYGDLDCFESPAVKTPHLDRLAAEGTRFSRFYAGSAVSSPTRASVLTGRYPLRFGITKHFTYATEIAMRAKWNLLALKGKPVEFFDIHADPSEQRNAIDDYPVLVSSLTDELQT